MGDFFLFFHLQSLIFLFEPRAVVTFPWNTVTAIQFEDPAGNVVEEVAIMGYSYHCALKFFQEFFQPRY